jgi:hypothetical protein
MANISQEAVLSAAWMLMNRARVAGSATDRSDTSDRLPNDTHGGQADTRESVRKLITAYLQTPTHISSTFPGW